MHNYWSTLQRISRFALWLSWFAVAWAALAMILRLTVRLIPNSLAYPILASGVAAFVGGCLGVAYLAIGARKRSAVASVAMAIALNFVYAAWFLYGLAGHVRNPLLF